MSFFSCFFFLVDCCQQQVLPLLIVIILTSGQLGDFSVLALNRMRKTSLHVLTGTTLWVSWICLVTVFSCITFISLFFLSKYVIQTIRVLIYSHLS